MKRHRSDRFRMPEKTPARTGKTGALVHAPWISRCLCHLPNLRSLFQIEVLIPIASALAGTARRGDLGPRLRFAFFRYATKFYFQVSFCVTRRPVTLPTL